MRTGLFFLFAWISVFLFQSSSEPTEIREYRGVHTLSPPAGLIKGTTPILSISEVCGDSSHDTLYGYIDNDQPYLRGVSQAYGGLFPQQPRDISASPACTSPINQTLSSSYQLQSFSIQLNSIKFSFGYYLFGLRRLLL